MQVDWTIDLGTIMVAMGMVGTAIVMVFGWAKIGFTIGSRLTSLEKELSEMKGVLVTLARQDERLKALETDVSDLRHGRGFILEIPSRVTPS